jgi:hypothetical protein
MNKYRTSFITTSGHPVDSRRMGGTVEAMLYGLVRREGTFELRPEE